MIARRISTVAVVAGLALAPLATDARIVRIPACGGGAHNLVLPADPAAPRNDGSACPKACHAVNDRREKSAGKRGRCC